MAEQLVAAFYKFSRVADPESLRSRLMAVAESAATLGTILVAAEGLNGTIAGPEAGVRAVLAAIQSEPGFEGLVAKESYTPKDVFVRMKVVVKEEIVKIGLPHVDPTAVVGQYVKPQDWNRLIADPNVVLVDTRNDYEFEVGSFRGAIDPRTEAFTDFPEWLRRHRPKLEGKKLAMFCTGGIRCEKATSLALSEGIKDVFHLDGGILKYLEEIPESESMWEGECYVFDRRVSVTHGVRPGTLTTCYGCRRTLKAEDLKSPHYREGICCENCVEELSDEQKARFAERRKQVVLAEQRGERHLGHIMPKTANPPGTRAATRAKRRTESASADQDGLTGCEPKLARPVLYSFRRCPYAMRARLALAASGVEVELREVVLRDKPPHLLKISPKATVPVLWLEDDCIIDESFDVMRWAVANPSASWPAAARLDFDVQTFCDHAESPAVTALVTTNDGDFKHHLDRYKYPHRYDDCDAAEHRQAGYAWLQELDASLSVSRHLLGDLVMLADLAVMPFVRQFANTDRSWFDEQPLPHLQRWLEGWLNCDLFLGIMQKYPQWCAPEPGKAFPLSPVQEPRLLPA